jgi:CRP-like cAMP-binding protein
MISPELIRRYPFFSGLKHEQIVALANVASEFKAETDHYFFHEGEMLDNLYLLVEGAAAIVIEVPSQNIEHTVSEQLTGNMLTSDVVTSVVGPGDVFGWSALISPHKATSSVKATTPCRVVAFNCHELRKTFKDDCEFGYLMVEKTARIIRDRLRDMRVESLAHMVLE